MSGQGEAMNLPLLALLWSIWCALHSLMVARPVTGFLARFLGIYFSYYRLFYNIMAGLTLMPLVLLTREMRGGVFFAWQGYWLILQGLMLVSAVLLFLAGSRRYDMGYFLGFKQIRSGVAHSLLSESVEFSTAGVFGLTRHPWYLASLLLIWSILPAYSAADLLVAGVLSLYLLIGTLLEEGKLVAEYGEPYRAYQRRVSMLLPWRWLRSKMH